MLALVQCTCISDCMEVKLSLTPHLESCLLVCRRLSHLSVPPRSWAACVFYYCWSVFYDLVPKCSTRRCTDMLCLRSRLSNAKSGWKKFPARWCPWPTPWERGRRSQPKNSPLLGSLYLGKSQYSFKMLHCYYKSYLIINQLQSAGRSNGNNNETVKLWSDGFESVGARCPLLFRLIKKTNQ